MYIRTDRLLLRELRPEDLEGYAAMCADPEVMRYLSHDASTLSREDAWRQMAMFVGHRALRGYGMWAVEELATGRFVGRVGLHYPEGWPDVISIIHPQNQRSIQLALRLGEQFERTIELRGLPHNLYRPGRSPASP